MAKDEIKKENMDGSVPDAVEKMNKQAGYDVPLAYALLNVLKTQELAETKVPPFESSCDLMAALDAVMRSSGGKLDSKGLAFLLNLAVAYGWHYAKEGKSLMRSNKAKDKMLAYIDASEKLTVEEKAVRKESIMRGYEAMIKAIQVSTVRLLDLKMKNEN